MSSVALDFTGFSDALCNCPNDVNTDCNGNWYKVHWAKRVFYRFDYFNKKRWCNLAESLIKEMDRLEREPVNFGASCGQNREFAERIKAAKSVKKQIKAYATSKNIQGKRNALRQRIAAMRYRIEEVNGGLDPVKTAAENEIETLKTLAERWKTAYPLYQDASIAPAEMEKLQEAARHPKFVRFLELDAAARNQFFRWALRDNNSVQAFVQFPSTCMRLKSALLSGRIGRFAKDVLFVDKQEGKKIFALPFQVEEADGTLATRQISILDESRRVTLKGGYALTIGQILNIFKKKNDDPGKLEFMGANGISNWHTHELGWWNPDTNSYKRIPLNKENSRWWEQLPEFENLTLAEVQNRYGVNQLKDGQWLAVARSTRESISLDIDGSHGYFEILIPDEESGNYSVYPMGKFAKNFPKNILEKCCFVTDTVESRIEYPDENPFYSHRQQAFAPFPIENDQGLELMEAIRKDLKAAREGNVVFQFGWENCAWWPQERLEKLLGRKKDGGQTPNFFVAHILESKPSAPFLKQIFSACRSLPESIKNPAVRVVAYCLGSRRGVWVEQDGEKVWKSMKTSQFKEECQAYLPGKLAERIQKGEIPGKVTFGHLFLRQT